ncbi:MAG: efflux RND transporter periplasmic adaptor subunit [Methylobacter sp.]|jgi:RND family efflux transporter MFP subunit|nr:efflux RND transporter periplasmic adaptor subunit [Methylobacter sp.]
MIKKLLKLLPALLIIIAVSGLSYYWLTNKPRAERVPPKAAAPLVEVLTPVAINHQVAIFAMGTVIASQSVNLTPRISGMVVSISPHFIEGGMLKKGEELVELDPTDYVLAIKRSENEVAKAQFNLKLEQGQQAIVRREFQLLGAELNEQEQELVLRKPHLTAAKAALTAAESALKQAHLDLERTRPVAPFNAIITTRNANLGAWMSAFSTGTPLARLVGTDSFWINASIPVDKLRWFNIPGINSETGSPVKITYETAWGKGVFRTGVIKRLQAEIEPEGRMAKVIIEVEDPLSQKPANKQAPPLMLGTYVRAEIAGNNLNDVIELPETVIHDGQKIWLTTEQQTLDIREVEPLWAEQGRIYLSKDQLPDNAAVITSDLPTPVQGMSVKIAQ